MSPKLFFTALIVMILPCACWSSGEIQLYSPANISFPTLAVPVGIRAIGMGDAYTASGNDVDALNWNPAGLSRMSGYQLGLAENEWSTALGISQEYISYGQSLGRGSAYAVSANYFNLGQLDERASTGALLGQSSASIIEGSAGYGWSMLDQNRLRLGLALQYGQENLFETTLSDFGGTLGMVYDLTRIYSAGISVNNLGTGAQGFSPPESLNLGVSALSLNRNLTVELDGQLPENSEPMINGGFEAKLGQLALRAGYRYAVNPEVGDVQTGFTAGAGFQAGVFRIDYAYVPYGSISTVNRVQLTVELPNDFFQPKIIGAVDTTTTAKAFYEKGLELEGSGDLVAALIQFERCTESYPPALRPTPQEFYLTAKQKVGALQAEVNEHGDNGQIAALTQGYVTHADAFMASGHYRDAIEQLKQAQEINPPGSPESAKLVAMIKSARSGLEQRLGRYRNDAEIADKESRMTIAIDNYRRILDIDPNDGEALAYFTNRRVEIKEMLELVHRKGIDQYVAGNVQEAVKIWTLGEALDYWGDIDFKRDIDKARNVLNLREKDGN